MIRNLWQSFQSNPIVIYSDENSISVTEINFPAVTICPALKLDIEGFDYEGIVEKLNNHELELKNLTEKELKYLQIINSIYKIDSTFNINIATDDFLERLKDFPSFWIPRHEEGNQVDGAYGNWSEKYSVNFTDVLWRTGFCSTFNFPLLNDLFNLNQ